MGSPEGISGPSSDDCFRQRRVSGVDFPFQYNIFGPYDMQWLTLRAAARATAHVLGMTNTGRRSQRVVQRPRSIRGIRQTSGQSFRRLFKSGCSIPHPDAYYDAMVPSVEPIQRFGIPILDNTGHYDGDQPERYFL